MNCSGFSMLVMTVVLGVTAHAADDTGAGGSSRSSAPQCSRIQAQVIVAAPIDEVWRTWTTNEGVQTFFSQHSNVKLELGGPFEMLFDITQPAGQQGSNGCSVLGYLPDEMFSFTWNAPPKFTFARQKFTWVVLQFESVSEKQTRVRLTHLGWDEMKTKYPDHADEFDQVREYFSKAWPHVLSWLQRRFEEGPRWDDAGAARWK